MFLRAEVEIAHPNIISDKPNFTMSSSIFVCVTVEAVFKLKTLLFTMST